jgi:hypothetical protein
MDRFGCRTPTRVGLLIEWADGLGWIITAGPGSAAILGAGLLITMGAGIGVLSVGPGGRVRFMVRITGGRRWWDSSAGVRVLALDLDSATSVGFRWLRLSGSMRGMARAFTAEGLAQ